MKVLKLFLFLVLFYNPVNGDNNTNEINKTQIEFKKIELEKIELKRKEMEQQKRDKALAEQQRIEHSVNEINEELLEVNESLKDDIWYTRYSNHQIYVDLENSHKETQKKINDITITKDPNKISEFTMQSKAFSNQLELLRDFKTPPFQSLTQPKDIEKIPEISNPFEILNGFAYIKSISKEKNDLSQSLDAMQKLINKLQKKEKLFKRLKKIYGSEYNESRLKRLQMDLHDIIITKNLADNTFKLYAKRIDDNILKANSDITAQIKRIGTIALIIGFILLLSFIFKYIVKKTVSDNERFYMANKAINMINFVLILIVLLSSFIENVSYLVTVLGFVSAGLAFAMKDFFMSAFGWMVISFGGSFHVGDRIKVVKNGTEYVGDIVDISVLRMTILEDVTLTSYNTNRRAGRIIFIPNNYIFTDLLANYTHGKIKTVWDGVDFTITFDSNHKKAAYITKEIVKKYSKGYTDISRKQLNKLRSQYSLKNINVEPRIYTFMEEYGVKISCWYMTNSYATLTLRSNIFSNILDAINKEDDIKIAYNTQVVNIKRDHELKPSHSDMQSE